MAVWSEVALAELKHGRIDSEFYKPNYIEIERNLLNHDNILLKSILKKIDVGHVGSMVQNYCQKGIILLQTQQVDQFFLNLNNCVKITPEFHEKLKKSQINKGDILIARSGSFGKASIYLEEDTINSADIIIIDIQESIITKGFLLSFLNSRFGSDQLIRFASGGVQGHVNLKILEELLIPIIDSSKQNAISILIEKSYAQKKRSQELYNQAQRCLEQKLELDNLSRDKSIGYETRFGEILNAFRMDAQCYNPNYIGYEKHLKKNVSYTKLRHLISSMDKGKQMPTASSGSMPYASIKDIDGLELISESYCSPTKETQIATNGNLLLAITGATIGKIGIVNRYDNIAFSGDLLKLEICNDIDPYYLLTVMQSKIGQSQCSRWITGSTNGHLAPKDVGKIVVPRLGEKTEDNISQKVAESLRLKEESKQLLEQAKQMVEDLIEQAAGEI
ncbi:restriction endonuclease subunit S [Desulfobacter curvatus]|uniref:restriction endonuclease subunit S n=1 Tax=Desulfobacter curvatus TaxID=2290 RepID=UPI00038124A0|nr:restriction endonuclease subunit S [Desulfobacter curvatus]